MRLPKLLPITVLLSFLTLSSCTYYACPPTSLCVPPMNCPDGNITFSAMDNLSNTSDHSYVCGVFKQCEDRICCSDPLGLPMNYTPNKTHWCYPAQESNATSDVSPVHVYPYPGLEEARPQNYENHSATICPFTSVCVPASACPQPSITFSAGMSDGNYTCGSHNDTAGHICCIITELGRSKRDIESADPKFLKNKRQIEFNSLSVKPIQFDFASRVHRNTDISAKRQMIYKDILPRSGESSEPYANSEEWACGRTLSVTKQLSRIYSPVGDRLAEEGDYPWHVAILSSTYEYLCSGVIVDERIVITVAHCLHDKAHKFRSSEDLLVRVGDLDLKRDTELHPAFDVKVELFVVHPDYSPISLTADIAVLELSESLRNLQHVRPICLPGSKYSPAINQCLVPGWGQFTRSKESKDEFSYELRAASFYIIDKALCQTALRRAKELGAFFKLQKNVLCAKGYTNSDTCKGDGGSGLVCKGKDVFVLKGLVSYGLSCGYDLPGVYTDVEKYLDFISNYKSYENKYGARDDRDKYVIHREHVTSKPSYGQPAAHTAPTSKPSYGQPVHTAPTSQPSYGQPGHAAPKKPSYLQPEETKHHGLKPSYQKPSYDTGNRPTYIEPDYNKPYEPIYDELEHVYNEHKPIYDVGLSYDEREPIYDERKPIYDEREPIYDEHRPIYHESKPIYDEHKPIYDENEPIYDEHKPIYHEHEPIYDDDEYDYIGNAYADSSSDYFPKEPYRGNQDYSPVRPDYIEAYGSDYHEPEHESDYYEPEHYESDYHEAGPYESDYHEPGQYESNYEPDYDYPPNQHIEDRYSYDDGYSRGDYEAPHEDLYSKGPNYRELNYDEEYDSLHKPSHDYSNANDEYIPHRRRYDDQDGDYLPNRPSHDAEYGVSRRPGHRDGYSEDDRLYYGDIPGYSHLRAAAKNAKTPSLKQGYAGKSPAVFVETLSAVMNNMKEESQSEVEEENIESPIFHLKI